MKLRRTLARIKRRFFKIPFEKNPRFPAFWFNHVFANQKTMVVQIGSNDGKTGDPLHKLLHQNIQWSGLFVEPIPETFQKLKANYPDTDRFHFENVAINEGQTMTFYHVDPAAKNHLKDLPYWFDQLGSFDRNHIINHLNGKLEPYILETELEGISLPALLERNKINQLDILHIDTEGYDWKILQQLNLEQFQPSFILYESNHLSRSDMQASFDFLSPSYQCYDVGIDVLAIHQSVIDKNTTLIQKHLTPVDL